LNLLFFGLGSIATKHIKVIKMLYKEANLYAFRNSKNGSNIEDVKNLYQFDEILKKDWSAVFITNPTSKHIDTINKILKFNVPIFIEKPISNNLDGIDILKKINENQIMTYVGCNLRFLDCLVYTKKNIINKFPQKIEEINIYCGSFLPDWRNQIDYKSSYSSIKELGGGVHLDLIHEIDYLYWFFGQPKKSSFVLKSNSNLKISSADYANYIIEYDNFCVSLILNYYRRKSKRMMEIVYDEFIINVDLLKNEVRMDNKLIYSSNQTFFETYVKQMKYFMDFIKQTDNSSINNAEDAFSVLKISLSNELKQ
tara:strand:- start:125 stop:1057 length:933 start_codon:yes stop_codon:yes gene_type:complete